MAAFWERTALASDWRWAMSDRTSNARCADTYRGPDGGCEHVCGGCGRVCGCSSSSNVSRSELAVGPCELFRGLGGQRSKAVSPRLLSVRLRFSSRLSLVTTSRFFYQPPLPSHSPFAIRLSSTARRRRRTAHASTVAGNSALRDNRPGLESARRRLRAPSHGSLRWPKTTTCSALHHHLPPSSSATRHEHTSRAQP